jgi:circadian clock protein KaiC
MYLVEGNPGTGKTTIGLRFMLEGAALGEKCLYITLSKTEDELRNRVSWLDAGQQHHGFRTCPAESLLDADQQKSLLYSSELALGAAPKQYFWNLNAWRRIGSC